MLGVGSPECFGQPLAVATAAYASRHRDGSPAENVRFKSQSKTWCSGHMWSYVVMVLPSILENLGMCVCVFFSLHFPPGPQALFAQVLECRRDGCAKGSRCEGSGSRRCQGFQRFWRVAIQWGLAVGDATLCWYRINCIYTIITFCGHSCQPPAGKLGKKNKWTILRSTVLQPPLDSLAGQRLVSAIL